MSSGRASPAGTAPGSGGGAMMPRGEKDPQLEGLPRGLLAPQAPEGLGCR